MTNSAKWRICQLLHYRNSANLDDHARGVERNRRALLTGGVATVARVVQVGTSLITVPLTLKYLGNERFGLWMTISSVLAMASFADFGVGNGVLNAVAKAYGKDDIEGVRKALSSGFAILSSIAALLLVSFFSAFRFINWADFFRVFSPQARVEAGPAIAVFATCFALNISMDVVQRVQLGLQQGYRNGLWQLCGSITGLIGVVVGIWLHVSLPVLVIAIAGAPILATLLNTIYFFGFVRPDLVPRIEFVSREEISQIVRLGGLFFILQVVAAVSVSADNFIIARALGAVNVPEYSIPQRMFGLTGLLLATLVAPLWPAYGEAISRRHFTWVRRTLTRSLLLVLLVSLAASSLLLLLAPKLMYWWVGPRIHPPFMLLLGLAVWSVFECGSFTIGAFLNGAEVVRFQIYLSGLFGIASVLTKVIFVKHFGIAVLPWSTLLCCAMIEVVPWIIFIPRFLSNMESHANSVVVPDGINCPLEMTRIGNYEDERC
jgi:O-antigen/teichoic acid export membrane protein